MDELDRDILQCLQGNSRMRASDIGKKVNLSVSSVIDRIRKLENQGIILRYTAVLDPKKLGNEITMMVGIKIAHPRYYDSFVERVLTNPNVAECQYLTGELDFMLKVTAASPENLEKVHHALTLLEGVDSITSYYVLKTVKNDYFALK